MSVQLTVHARNLNGRDTCPAAGWVAHTTGASSYVEQRDAWQAAGCWSHRGAYCSGSVRRSRSWTSQTIVPPPLLLLLLLLPLLLLLLLLLRTR